MKSNWSLLCAPGFVLSAFCPPSGSSCPSKSRGVSGERDPALLGAGGGHKPRALAHGYSSSSSAEGLCAAMILSAIGWGTIS